MPVKVKISYTPDEEAKITRLEALLKSLLPRHKVKKSTGIMELPEKQAQEDLRPFLPWHEQGRNRSARRC